MPVEFSRWRSCGRGYAAANVRHGMQILIGRNKGLVDRSGLRLFADHRRRFPMRPQWLLRVRGSAERTDLLS